MHADEPYLDPGEQSPDVTQAMLETVRDDRGLTITEADLGGSYRLEAVDSKGERWIVTGADRGRALILLMQAIGYTLGMPGDDSPLPDH